MAQVVFNSAFRFDSFDFRALYSSLPSYALIDNIGVTVNSTMVPGFEGTYTATDIAAWWDGSPNPPTAPECFFLTGEDLQNDGISPLTLGTVTGLYARTTPMTGQEYLAIAGFSLNAATIMNAMGTTSLTDDRQVLIQMLAGDDRIMASDFDDQVFGAQGNDTISGNGGNDLIAGNAGNDYLDGGAGNDTVNGGTQQDSLLGAGGNDVLIGGADNDRLWGSVGTDRLEGGRGRDTMAGGADAVRDVFVFTSTLDSAAGLSRDVIQNFVSGTDDIALTAIDANTDVANNQAFAFKGTVATAYSVWYATSSGNTVVFADVTGDLTADFSLLLVGVTSVSGSDFLL